MQIFTNFVNSYLSFSSRLKLQKLKQIFIYHKPLYQKYIATNLLVYGTDHAKVDAICAGVLFSLFRNQAHSLANFRILAILYYIFAFGFQALLGFAVDFFLISTNSGIIGMHISI